jgi:hypothetical protein
MALKGERIASLSSFFKYACRRVVARERPQLRPAADAGFAYLWKDEPEGPRKAPPPGFSG